MFLQIFTSIFNSFAARSVHHMDLTAGGITQPLGLCVKLTGRLLPVRWKHSGGSASARLLTHISSTSAPHCFPGSACPSAGPGARRWMPAAGGRRADTCPLSSPSCCDLEKQRLWHHFRVKLSVSPASSATKRCFAMRFALQNIQWSTRETCRVFLTLHVSLKRTCYLKNIT